MSREDLDGIYEYHDGTKHYFHRFAQSLGFLDWASQPRPFRSYEGAPIVSLFPGPGAQAPAGWRPVTYDQLFTGSLTPPAPVTLPALGYFLRHALGLSAWKVFRKSRWSLRVNPSSGNLHPTEAYVVTGALTTENGPGVWHYAPDRHVLEQRCRFEPDAWRTLGVGEPAQAFLVALTSIHWRESWKYGERAFRYCQHDLGHAIAALSLSAALCGWRVTMLDAWPHRAIATLAGLDRDADYGDAEREEPACVLLVTAAPRTDRPPDDAGFLDAVRGSRWFGRASQLSEDHVTWRFIDQVARVTENRGRTERGRTLTPAAPGLVENGGAPEAAADAGPALAARGEAEVSDAVPADRNLAAAAILLQRRSAVAFDGHSDMTQEQFVRMLSRTLPGPGAPWNALLWSPRIHLALFVHRVVGVVPGLYLLARDESTVPRLKAASISAFRWELADDGLPLWRLQEGDYRQRSARVSCDQEIAADGFFSLGMIADFEASLDEHGPSFYRQLFWEAGVVGQVLYLEAEAAGARATGIGCFYDEPVHDLLGLKGHAFQSLYHFTVGMPVEDGRLTTEPGYAWETRA